MLRYFLYSLITLTILSCKKSNFLDAKSNQALIIPEDLDELQSLMDNINVNNGTGQGIIPALGEIGADNYYALRFPTTSSGPVLRSLYLWDHKINTPNTTRLYDWDYPYRCILYSNIAMEGLSKLVPNPSEVSQFNNIKGSALFNRSHMFYQLAQVFAVPFINEGIDDKFGIPLKLTADVNDLPNRSTVTETYNQILKDLKESVNLLPIVPEYKTRPSKAAALALIARTYQTMQNYDSSLAYSDACLQQFSSLIDFNDKSIVNTSGSPGIRQRYNPEVIFHAKIVQTNITGLMYSTSSIRVDTALYKSYSSDDLRKTVFFGSSNPGNSFKGSYDASTSALFGGIAVDEVYLIRAESYARTGKIEKAMEDLNTLLIKRWKKDAFVPFTASSPEEALNLILEERRKELIFRGLRWTDIRRLNRENANIALTRIVDGQVYTLSPNDKKYTFLIPEDVMSFHPNWAQNPR